MASRKPGELKIGGQLELDVTLKNLKRLEKQLLATQKKIQSELKLDNVARADKSGKSKPLSDQARFNLERSSKSFDAAQRQLNARTQTLEKLNKSSGSFAKLAEAERRILQKEIAGVSVAANKAREGFKSLSDFTGEVTGRTARKFTAAIKSGTDAVNQQTKANNAVTAQINDFAVQKRREVLEAKKSISNQRVLNARNARLAKQKVAQDIAVSSGSGSLSGLNIASVKREDIQGLRDYAKAQQSATQASLNSSRLSRLANSTTAQGAAIDRSGSSFGRLNNLLQQQTSIVTQLESRYRSLNSPLAQTTLLMRQFFRFAIGYGALYQMLGAITALGRGILELDEQLHSIQAITAATNEEMAGLETTIKRIAVSTKFTTTQIAQATRVLGQAGVTPKDLPGALQATADFAAATNSDLAIAADLVTTTRNVFKELDDNTISNQLTKAINISKLTAEDLKTILSLSAQTARSYNLASEQYLSAATTLRNAGIKASTVSTGLRQGLIEVFSPDASTVKALKARYRQLGEEVTEEVVKQRFFGFTKEDNPLLAVLSELKRLGFADDAQKEFQRAFDVRAANAIKALISNYDELAEAEARITFGTSAADAAEIQMESLNNSLSNLGAAFTVLGDQILGGAVGSMETFVDSITDAIVALTDLDTELKKQGKAGLGSTLLPGLAGAGAGALLGRGVAGRGALGLAGGVAGGAAGAGSVAGGAVLTALLAALGISAGSSAIKSFKAGQVALGSGLGQQLGLFGSKKLAGSALARAATAFIPVIGPVISGILTVLTIMGVFSSLLLDGQSAVEEAANRAAGAKADLDKTSAQLREAQARSSEFDVDAARAGRSDGKTANTLVELQKDIEDYDLAVTQAFGSISEGKRAEFEKALTRFSKVGVGERSGLASALRQITEIEGTAEDLDRLIFDISTEGNSILARQRAFLEEIFDSQNKANQQLIAGNQQGLDIAGPDFSQQRNTLAAFDSVPQLDLIISGLEEFSTEATASFIEAYLNALTEGSRQSILDLADSESDKLGEFLEAQIDSLLASGQADEISVKISLSNLVNNIPTAGEAALTYIDAVNRQIEKSIRELQSLSLLSDSEVARGAGFRGVGPVGGLGPQGRDNAATFVSALQNSLRELEARRVSVGSNSERILEGERDSAESAVLQFAEVLKTETGKQFAQEVLAGPTNSRAKSVIKDLMATPGAFEKWAEEVQGDINIDELDNIQFGPLIESILNIMRSISQSTNTALESEREAKKIEATLPSVGNLTKINSITKQISNLLGSNKDGIGILSDPNNPNNPYKLLADLQKEEKLKEIAGVQRDIDNEGKGARDLKSTEKIRTLEIKRAKLVNQLANIDIDTLAAIQKVNDKLAEIDRTNRRQLATLQKTNAQEGLVDSGVTGDRGLFQDSIDKINAANAELIQVFREELIAKGLEEGSELFQAEVAERSNILRDLRENAPEFISALETFTSGLLREAERIRNRPITSGGAPQDALSERAGTVGNDRRFQEAANILASLSVESKALETRISELQGLLDNGGLSQAGAEVVNNELEDTRNELTRLGQESALVTLLLKENSASVADQVTAYRQQILNVQTLNEALQDSDFAFRNLAQNTNTAVVGAVNSLGDALAQFVLDGGSFKEFLGNVFLDLGRELATQAIKTLVTEVASAGLAKLGASGATSLLGKLAGGAAGGGATLSAALIPSATALTGSATALTTSGGLLTSSAGALTAAAGALTTAAGASGGSSATGGFASLFGGLAGGGAGGGAAATGAVLRKGRLVKSFASGGIIKGPGTGTSDSILGIHNSRGKKSPIAVSDGESILNVPATNFLGDDFIHALNAGKIGNFKTGGIMQSSAAVSAAASRPAVSSPNVTNQNDTTIINAIDSGSVVSSGLDTPAGTRAILNFMRANKSSVQRIIN